MIHRLGQDNLEGKVKKGREIRKRIRPSPRVENIFLLFINF
jgi:hypothetical protein